MKGELGEGRGVARDRRVFGMVFRHAAGALRCSTRAPVRFVLAVFMWPILRLDVFCEPVGVHSFGCGGVVIMCSVVRLFV